MILSRIRNTNLLAGAFVEECCITVQQDGKSVTAFTEYKGKMRVTEWGGTSSALELLSITGVSNNPDIERKIELAKEWLINKQADDGSWEAAEMQCSEATSAVLYDLAKLNILKPEKQDLAIKYIKSCYQPQKGYFISCPNIHQTPHIYTTYLAVRTLAKYDCLSEEEKREILLNIGKSKMVDDNWGAAYRGRAGDAAHTAMALLIMFYCGKPAKDIKKEYRKNIRWLKKQIRGILTYNNGFLYEAIEVYSDSENDEYGKVAHILKSYHYQLSLLCSLFLKIRDYGCAYRLIELMIKERGFLGGWGINGGEKHFVWAAQQVVDCMKEFEDEVFLGKPSFWGILRTFTYKIPFFWIKVLLTLIMIGMTIWLVKSYDKGPDYIVTIIFMIVPWIIKRED